jgi:hypothetical protein
MVKRSSSREFNLPVVGPLVRGETRLVPLGRAHGCCQTLRRPGTALLARERGGPGLWHDGTAAPRGRIDPDREDTASLDRR